MRSYLNLFGQSPFVSLRLHMDNVAQCIELLPSLYNALDTKQYEKLDAIAESISQAEHQADIVKNDIRNHLPKSLFMPIDRGQLLEILSMQDQIADKVEDIAVLTTFKQLELLEPIREPFKLFMDKNLEAFNDGYQIIKELHELLESSFGGLEAEHVKALVDSVAFKEHEADLLQHKLLRAIFACEGAMTFGTFYLWQKLIQAMGDISNLSEKLANRIRMTLELQ
jgi:hypothetical protein